ncbi:MAG: ABC transporter ATP-binding protein [Pseudomonadota bacterium]
MLELQGINSGYGDAQVLRDVSFEVRAGEILCLMGRNGAGKTTTMRSIMGLLPLISGRVMLDGLEISSLPAHSISRAGIGYIPQGRRLFSGLTVAQNLEVGLMAGGAAKSNLTRVLELFPRLQERLKQPAQTLSGGEQQMLATARALCLQPKALLLDEPTEGLQPSIIKTIQDVIIQMRDENLAVLLVEQRIEAVLELADRVIFIENGKIADTLTVEALRQDRTPFTKYIGI